MKIFIFILILLLGTVSITFISNQFITTKMVGVLIAILDICILCWWFLGWKKDSCDWCKERVVLRRYKYYESERNKGLTEDNIIFCSLKCENAYKSSENVKETRVRWIDDDD